MPRALQGRGRWGGWGAGGWGAAREGHSAQPNLGQPGPGPPGVARSPVRGEGRSMPRFLFKRCLNNHRNPAPATRVPAACLRHLGPQSLSHYSGSGERGPPREWDAGPLRVGRRRDGVPSSESPPFSEAGAAAGMGPVVQADGGRDVVNPIAGHRLRTAVCTPPSSLASDTLAPVVAQGSRPAIAGHAPSPESRCFVRPGRHTCSRARR